MLLFPEETFLALGIDLTDSGHPALDIEVFALYCRAAERSGWLLIDAVTWMWYIIDWAKGEAWKHDIQNMRSMKTRRSLIG